MKAARLVTVLGVAIVVSALMQRCWGMNQLPEVGISGRVAGLLGNDHVVIKVAGPTTYRTTTRASGMWSLTTIEEGAYVITPVHARYSFAPETITVTISASSVDDLNFSATPEKAPGTHRWRYWALVRLGTGVGWSDADSTPPGGKLASLCVGDSNPFL